MPYLSTAGLMNEKASFDQEKKKLLNLNFNQFYVLDVSILYFYAKTGIILLISGAKQMTIWMWSVYYLKTSS